MTRLIEGLVNSDYEAVVSVTLRSPQGQAREVDAVVDTGFNRYLTLPPTLVAELEAAPLGRSRLVLANGNEDTFEVCAVTVLWDGEPRYVETYVADSTPLIGMLLLEGHSLYMQIKDGGHVTIQPEQ